MTTDPSAPSSSDEDSETTTSSATTTSSSDEEASPPPPPPPGAPPAGPSAPPPAYDLAAAPRELLVTIVKAAQREGLGDWKAHAKVRGRAERCNAAAACSGSARLSPPVLSSLSPSLLQTHKLPHADPARARPAALVAFATDLWRGGGAGARLVGRVAEHHEQVAAEAAAAAAVAAGATAPADPPAHHRRRSKPHHHSTPHPPVALTAAGLHALIHRTAAHPRFGESYASLPSTSEGWLRAPRPAPVRPPSSPPPPGTPPPPLLALDCEMVGTEADGSALVRLALVRARPTGLQVEGEGAAVLLQPPLLHHASPGAPGPAATAALSRLGYGAVDVLLAALVRPEGTVTDWRTGITGLGPGSLDGAPLSRAGAARAVAAALADCHAAALASAAAAGMTDTAHLLPPILIGHALHHDLRALRLDAGPVIDTALVFAYAGLPRCAPGLADLHDALCPGLPLRPAADAVAEPPPPPTSQPEEDAEVPRSPPPPVPPPPPPPHCCVADAAAALALAALAAAAPHDGAPAPLPPPARKAPREALCRLLVHGLSRAAVLAEAKAGGGGVGGGAGSTAPPDEDDALLSAAAARLAAAVLAAAPPASVEPAGPAKAWAIYPDPGAADAAFAALAADRRETDALGRAQKVVALAAGGAGGSAKVRRAAAHAGLTHGVDRKKRDRAPASVAHGKRLRAAGK